MLGLSKPWSVARVELELEHNCIPVHVECGQGAAAEVQDWAD